MKRGNEAKPPTLEELAILLAARRRKPIELWLERFGESAPDAALERMWSACKNGEAMLAIANRFADRDVVTRAACACARTVASLAVSHERLLASTLDTAERWCAGTATLDEVRAAADEVLAAERLTFEQNSTGAATVACAAAAAAALSAFGETTRFRADDPVEHRTADDVGQSVRVAVSRSVVESFLALHPEATLDDPRLPARIEKVRDAALAECADEVRRFVPTIRASSIAPKRRR